MKDSFFARCRGARVFSVGAGLFVLFGPWCRSMPLIRDGAAAVSIVLPDHPLASERFAAEELQAYLAKISGARPAIVADSARPAGPVVTVGATHDVPAALLDTLAVEECVIRTVSENRLMIVGGRKPPVTDAKGKTWVQDRGTLYGVYEFLYRLGVRWYDPSPIGEVVPHRRTVTVAAVDYRHKPDFPYRGGYSGLWAVRNRYNGNAWGGPEWGGLRYEWFSHMYYCVAPPKRYFKTHPEWYPSVEGRRVPKGQLCLTAPGLVDRFVQFALAAFKSNPQMSVLGIEANDGHGWCTCDACRAMDVPTLKTPYGTVSMAPRIVAFNAQVARKVAEKNPNAILGWYIYSDHTEVPPGVTALPDNLHGRVCTYASGYSNYAEPIETGASPQNRRLRRVLAGYRKLLKHLSTYEYWSGYQWFGPIPIRKAIAANIRYYRKSKLEGCYQLGPRHWGSQGFNYWLAARLLWDSSQSEDALLDDYCRNFFGPAGDAVKQYMLYLENAVAVSGQAVMSGGAYIEPIFSKDVIARGRSLLQQAAARADTPVRRARVRRLLAGLDFADRAGRMDRLEKRGDLEAALAEGRALIEWMNTLCPGKKTRTSMIERYTGKISARSDKGDIEGAAVQAKKLEKWLSSIENGRFVFASMDSEPGGHLRDRVADLAKKVREFGRIMAVCDPVCGVPERWRFKLDPKDRGKAAGWFKADFEDSHWAEIPIGVWWENAGYPGYDGWAWYRTEVEIPKRFRGRRVDLFFGAVDGDALVYVNGRLAGTHKLGKNGKGWDEAFSVDISRFVRFGGKNSLTVAVFDDSAYGGIWKFVRLQSPRPDALTRGRVRLPIERDARTAFLLDFDKTVSGWMANEKYGPGAAPTRDNRAAFFDAPTTPKVGIRTSVMLPPTGTFECWIQPVGMQRRHATVCTVGSVGNTKLNVYMDSANRVHACVVRKSGNESVVSKSVLPDARWTHIAATWGETSPVTLFVNGKMDVTGTGVGPPYAFGRDVLWIGCQPWYVKDAPGHAAWYTDLNFHGLIDDVRFSTGVRERLDAFAPP